MFSNKGTERIKTETILGYIDLKDEGEIQQAYWTIYNEGRTKND